MNDKIYLKELKHWDGEKYVTLDMIGITEQTITVVVTDAGKITVREYDLYEDNNGVFFEYGPNFARIEVSDFVELER